MNEIERIRSQIESGEIYLALEALKVLSQRSGERNIISLLLFRLSSAKNKMVSDAGFNESLQTELNRIVYAALDTLTEIEQSRMHIFLGRLETKGFNLDANLFEHTDFIHALSSTLDVVLRTRRDEKIIFLANLLSNTFKDAGDEDMDEFDYNLQALGDLSYTEIQILATLYRFQQDILSHDKIAYEKHKLNSKNWLIFIEKAQNELKIEQEECEAYLSAMEKSGMIVFPRHSSTNDQRFYGAYTTKLFDKLYSKIIN